MEDSIGALWKKSSPKAEYMTGQIEIEGKKISIVCFKNKSKKEEKHPDWKIYISQPKQQPNNTDTYKQPETKQDEPDNSSDLPF